VTYVVEGGHTGEVTSLSVCAVKPLFATACRSDCTVIVWNYQSRLPVSRKSLECMRVMGAAPVLGI
jgi:WD40 repeat protein